MCATIDRQIRARLDRIPQQANKQKTTEPTAAKEKTGRASSPRGQETGQTARQKSANRGSDDIAEAKLALTCYNCQKPGYVARSCPKPMTEKRKRYLANVVKELQAIEEAESSGKEDV